MSVRRDDGSMKRPFSCLALLAGFFLISFSAHTQTKPSAGVTPPGAEVAKVTFSSSPAFPEVGQTIEFTGRSPEIIVSWDWNFGDGKSSLRKNPRHSFKTPGFYRVTLAAETLEGVVGTLCRTISVRPRAIASFTFSPVAPKIGQAIKFTDTTTGSPSSWHWDFGDGTSSTAQNPTHVYKAAAPYNVTLTSETLSGARSVSRTVKVVTPTPEPSLRPSFVYVPSSPWPGQVIRFTDTSAGSPTSWHWDFNDGVTSAEQNPSHTFAAAGNYNVTLTVANSTGSKSASTSILIGSEDPGKTAATPSGEVKAASPSLEDVKAAIARAKAGDTVLVPAGEAVWDQQLVITKGIHLIGAGAGKTNIISHHAAPNPNSVLTSTNYLIVYNPASPLENTPFRLSGFSLDFDHKCFGVMLRNKSTTAINKIRIDHNRMNNANVGTDSPWRGVNIHIYGTVYGVADNNEFMSGYIRCNGLDETTWNNLVFSFGTQDNFYFEDNKFISPDTMFFYGEMGGRYCARYNTFDATASTNGLYPFADMHGNQPNAHNATMGAEIYENVISAGTKGVCLLDQRGGKALVYDNVIRTSGPAFAKAREEFLDSINPPKSSPHSAQPQHVSDSYYWRNRKNGTTRIGSSITETIDYGGNLGIVPQENRDIWFEKPNYDGTSGVGVGPLANRPTTCTVGVAYWATDTKTLYKCTTANSWTMYYTPYPYPHPLRASLSN